MASANDRSTWVLERLLVLQCQAGDEHAFEELVAKFDPRLRYYVSSLVGRADLAEDLMQDVWLDVVRNLRNLRKAESFKSWLYRIARSYACLHMRRSARQPRLESFAADPPAPEPPDFSPDDATHIHRCMARLSPEHRDVLLLRFLENMSYEEIAAAVGCAAGTCRSRIHYAKTALRREMEKPYGQAELGR